MRPRGPDRRGQLAALPEGAFPVNCARAGIVDHDALGEPLRLPGAPPLDVPPRSRHRRPHPSSLAGIVLSLHAACGSGDIEVHAVPHDIMLVLTGREPLYPVVRPR
jgi:hypothetical protein